MDIKHTFMIKIYILPIKLQYKININIIIIIMYNNGVEKAIKNRLFSTKQAKRATKRYFLGIFFDKTFDISKKTFIFAAEI